MAACFAPLRQPRAATKAELLHAGPCHSIVRIVACHSIVRIVRIVARCSKRCARCSNNRLLLHNVSQDPTKLRAQELEYDAVPSIHPETNAQIQSLLHEVVWETSKS
jgi:hypothetical protein